MSVAICLLPAIQRSKPVEKLRLTGGFGVMEKITVLRAHLTQRAADWLYGRANLVDTKTVRRCQGV